MSCQRGNTLYIGYDESNHGQYPEICVCIFSLFFEDIAPTKKGHFLSKKRAPKTCFSEKLISRDYSFLLLGRREKEQIKESNLLGVILTSLVREDIPPEIDFLHFFIDGEYRQEKITYSQNLISSQCAFNSTNISFDYGKDFDRKYPLVNMADEVAYHFFKSYTLDNLTKNIHLRDLMDCLV